MSARDWSIDFFNGEEKKSLIIIAGRPIGEPLYDKKDNSVAKIVPPKLRNAILLPLAKAIKRLHEQQIAHRNIRPDNIFYKNNKKAAVVLGEWVTTPPGLLQPYSYETVMSGMSVLESRSSDYLADDVYALGALTCSLLYGESYDFTDLQERENMLYKKLDSGSVSYFLSGKGVFEQFTPFLNGTLADHPRDRWKIQDVLDWLEGRGAKLVIGFGDLRGGRPKRFNKRDNYALDELAFSLSEDWDNAFPLLENNELLNWLRFSVVDPKRTEELQETIENSTALKGSNAFQKNALLSKLLVRLSPKLPLCWKALKVMPGGIGFYLAHLLLKGEDTALVHSIIHARVALHWEAGQKDFGNKPKKYAYTFEMLPRVLDKKRKGYGIECVLYILNQDLPCLSGTVVKYFVTDMVSLLAAIESVLQKTPEAVVKILDQHTLAFIIARTRLIREGDLRNISSADPLEVTFSKLHILSKIQQKSSAVPLVATASAFEKVTKKVVKKYKHLPTRKQLEGAIKKAVNAGCLTSLNNLVDNKHALTQDAIRFKQACQLYDMFEGEIEHIQKNILEQESPRRLAKSRQYAALVSASLGSVSIFGYLLYYFFEWTLL